MRLEAESFRHLDGCAVEYRNDRKASQSVQVALTADAGRIRTRFDEPYARTEGRYDVDVRFFDENGSRSRYTLLVNGVAQGAAWESAGKGGGWTTQTVRDVPIRIGDEIAVEASGKPARLDYVELNATAATIAAEPKPAPGLLRVAVVQMALRPTLAENRDRIIAGIAEAAERNARVAVFPERALTGSGSERQDARRRSSGGDPQRGAGAANQCRVRGAYLAAFHQEKRQLDARPRSRRPRPAALRKALQQSSRHDARRLRRGRRAVRHGDLRRPLAARRGGDPHSARRAGPLRAVEQLCLRMGRALPVVLERPAGDAQHGVVHSLQQRERGLRRRRVGRPFETRAQRHHCPRWPRRRRRARRHRGTCHRRHRSRGRHALGSDGTLGASGAASVLGSRPQAAPRRDDRHFVLPAAQVAGNRDHARRRAGGRRSATDGSR